MKQIYDLRLAGKEHFLYLIRRILILVGLNCLFYLSPQIASAQLSCNCTDYLYVNDPTLDITHKFTVNPTTGQVDGEIDAPNWLAPRVIVNPHGVAGDVNGNLYVAQLDQQSDPTTNMLFQLDCDGNVKSNNAIPGWINSYNLATIGNTLYAAGGGSTLASYGVYKYDLCTKAQTGFLSLGTSNEINWGMSVGLDGKIYATSNWGGLAGNFKVYRIEPDFSSYTTVISIPNLDVNRYALGVTDDEFGNLYFVVTNAGSNGATTIYKISPSGTILHTISDATLNQSGFGGAWGIKYFPSAGKLYIGTLGDDCVAVINSGGASGMMLYQSTLGVPHVPGTYAKAINLVKECCPIPSTFTIDQTLCEAGIGDVLFLQELTGCEGTICGGDWTADAGNFGFTFDNCANTITISSANACGTFTLSGSTDQCGSYDITINVEVLTAAAATVSADQMVCPAEVPATLVATGAGAYQWQSSTTDCNSGFTDILGADQATYSPGALSATTYFRVISSVDGSCSSGNCMATSNCITITVKALDDPSFSYASPFCPDEANPFPSITGDPGGNFSSSPAGLDLDTGTGEINLAGSTPGTYTITYTTVGPCPQSSSEMVTINNSVSGVSVSSTPSTCTGFSANDDGFITVTAVIDADKYGISTGGSYSGPNYAAALSVPAPPFVAQSGVSGTGGTYTIRFFNAGGTCYLDEVITVGAINCTYDFGDLPDPDYATTYANGGPRHLFSPTNDVILGSLIDDDDDGHPSATAGEDTVDGDDGDGIDDEDGVTEPTMIFEGETAIFEVAVVNNKNVDAKLIGFIDWNGDGDFADDEEMQFVTIPASSGSTTVTLTFNVPLDGATYTDLGARFRISTDPDFITNMPWDGAAYDGEVEDYLVQVKEVDYGDLPANYLTTHDDDGPRHGVAETPVVFLGGTPDTENDGTPDALATGDGADEDAVVFPAMFFAGETAALDVTVTNDSGTDAKLIGFIDWNNDGDFADDEEMQFLTIPTGNLGQVFTLVFNVPADAVTYLSLGARFRISTDPDFIANMPSDGFAMDGEVEDYLIEVKDVDYGDLPAAYNNTHAEDGPRHGLLETPEVYFGALVDADDDGQPSATAGEDAINGDDGDGIDDEDGVTEPAMIFQGQPAVFNIDVVNAGSASAKVVGFVDWNNDGLFNGPEEMQSITVGGGMITTVSLTFNVPLNAEVETELGARFRISTDLDFINNMSSDGFAMDGEVEDYLVTVKPLDYGDLPANYANTDAEDGPSHGLPPVPEVYFGDIVDPDADGQEDPLAEGDDNDEANDDDGVELPAMLFQGEQATFTLTASNNSGSDAKIVGWVDWNADGVLDAGEMVAAAALLPTGSVDATVELVFDVPLDAAYYTDLGVRFRISTDPAFLTEAGMLSTGFLMDGEVEDYLVQVKPLDYGDLNPDYNTVYEDNGPRHGLPETPDVYLGTAVDEEPDGQPSATAGEDALDGDDGTDDDEDGVTEPTMIFAGEDAVFDVAVVNNSEAEAKVVGYIDWNADGLFDGPGEMQSTTVAGGTSATVTLTFAVPLDAGIYTDLGARFRISTDQAAVMSPDGFAMDGEVEDYYVSVKPVDYGDLPTPYLTTNADDGANHGVPEEPEVFLGAGVDYELDGLPDADAGETNTGGDDADGNDDEDGVLEPAMLFQGEAATFTLTVSNLGEAEAKVVGYIDWNNDGLFDGPNEMVSQLVAGLSNGVDIDLIFSVPTDAITGQPLGARFRISTDQAAVMSPTGLAMDGEVEDYLVVVKPLDYGDLESPYNTVFEDDGPRHGVPETPLVYFGNGVDGDDDGQPSVTAGEDAADGDDGDEGDDEDGITEPAMIFRGQTAEFLVAVVNNSDVVAKVVGFIDWNNDGLFDAAEEMQFATVAATTSETVTMTFNVPLDAAVYTDLGARFRITTDEAYLQAEVMSPDGFVMDGEVEDYYVRVKPLDFGDLPAEYPTVYEENGPQHGLPEEPLVYIGDAPDYETDGQPDTDAGETGNGDAADEDGVVEPPMLFQGELATFTVTVSNGEAVDGKLVGWVDWNNNAQFELGEMEFATVSAGADHEEIELTFDVPLNAVYYTDLGVRFRISTDPTFLTEAGMLSTGFLMDGEVEDYLVQVKPLDYGDLNAPYNTTYEDDGPRHGLPQTPNVYFGTAVDEDPNGQPSATAGEDVVDGDDGDGTDDEDGITEPAMLFQGEIATFDVAVVNTSESDAKVVGYIDWNNDGDFLDEEEMQSTTASGSGTVSLTFQVPLDAVYYTDLAARFRITTDEDFATNMSPDGFVMDGEVEDYLVRVKPLDFGDLPDIFPNIYEEDGPRHGRPEFPVVYIGTGVDEEPDGQPNDQAQGDDNNGANDENGVTPPAMLFQGEAALFEIAVTNDSDNEAKLIGFIDWNQDGDFADEEEMQFVLVAPNSGATIQMLTFQVPLNAVYYEDLGARFRFSTDENFINEMPAGGFAMDGEVEDYLVRVKPLDFGDLPDLFIVEYEEDGPRHGLPEDREVYIGELVDEDPNGQPSPSAGLEGDGDDGDGTDDEDGVTKPEEIFRGQPATFLVDVVNNSAQPAKLVGFVDWNRDGDFEDEGEMSAVIIDPNTVDQVEVVFNVPQDAEFYLPLTGARFRITTDPAFFTEAGMSANGFVMDGEVEDCLVEVSPVEYGDLPASYGTLLADDGASHGEVVDGDLYLGELIDQDYDGQSDPMNMALGDDNDESDDDDGIEFITPLIPGDTAKIRVDVTVLKDVDAFLNAWMDFDGNGVMDPTDAIEVFAVDGTAITPTTNLAVEDGTYVLCFLVPETATFAPGGMAYSRFRLSSEGNLAPTGFTMTGEVEDYKVQLAKVGNLVWRDYNYNGIQDEGEPGIETPTEVTLVFAGEDGEFGTEDDFESRDITDENGLYSFCGLIEDAESMYKLIFTSDFFPTLSNQEGVDEDKDSDGEVLSDTTVAVMFLLDEIGAQPLAEAGINDDPNDQGNFPDAVTDQTFDQGYAGFDYGDLPDEYLTSDDSNEGEGTRHIYFPGKHLGSCLDLDLDGQPSEYGDGDDANVGVYTDGECAEEGDDEDGITFLTPLIPGYTAKVEITYTNTAGEIPEDAYLNAWIDWNGDGILDASDKLAFTLVDGNPVNSENLPLAPGEDVTLVACFDVPTTALFRDGNAYARFRMGCEEDMPSFGTILGGEVEDYVLPLAKIGNLAWFDNDLDGTQDGEAGVPQELGVGGVEFILTYAGYGDTEFGNGNDFEYTTITDGQGLYSFCGLIEGKYMVEVQKYDDDETDADHETPEHYILTVSDLAGGDDELDSDFSPAIMVVIPDLLTNDLVTGENGYLDAPGQEGFPDNQDDLTIDAGWIPEPNVEALVNIAGVDFGPDETNCDEFNIIVDICIKNTGYVEEEGVLVGAPLANLSALLDLQAEMGDMFVSMDGAPELLAELGYDNTMLMAMPAADRLPGINGGFDGSGDTELLNGGGILYPGENICIRLNVTVDPTKVTMEAAMAVDLQAKVQGLAVNYQGVPIPDYFNEGAQYVAIDLSNNDWNFTGGFHDADDAEAFGNCFKTIDPLVVHNQVNISANGDCGVCIDPSEVVLNYQEACNEDNYPLGGFYRISVEGVAEDALEVCVDGTNIVDGKFVYSIRTVTQRCFPTWGEVLLEDKTLPTLVCPDELSEVNNEPLVCADIEAILLEGTESYEVDKDGNVVKITDELKAILDLTGYAHAEDNCSGLTIYITDELLPSENCEDQTIKRTFWVQAEVQGVVETETCMQLIHFTKPTLENVTEVEAVELSCSEEIKLDANGNPHPDETGYPQVVTGMGTYDLAPEFCNLAAGYTDGARIEVCTGTYKVVRHWQVIDWCGEEGVKLYEFEQIIKVGDYEGPKVVCEAVDYDHDGIDDLRTYSTGPYDCTAAFEVPLPTVTDNCSGWSILTEIVSNGKVVKTIPVNGNRYVSGIPVGCHEIRYTVTDDCGNKTIEYCPFQVLDQVAPIAVCDDDLNISLGGQSFARITAEDIDEGSSDNCGPIRVEVRRRIQDANTYACLERFDYNGNGDVIGDEVNLSIEFGDPDGDGVGDEFYYTPWEPYVDFNCCDMGENVRIELRVWDDANGSGVFGDAVELPVCFDYAVQTVKDNYNVCWLDVLIEDKVPPVCTPPAAVRVDCDELPYNFDPQDEVLMTKLFGAAEGFDNCGNYTIEELEADTTGLNDCGSGQFIRRFRVTDVKGIQSAVCQQIVTVDQIHDYWIKFPADAQANCGTPNPDTIQTSEGACDLLAISVKEETFSASGDECYKIFRTYSVINWCEYDGQSAPVVVSRDEDCDGTPGDEAVYVIVKTKKKTDPCYDYYGNEPADHYQHVWYDRDNDPFNLLPKAGTKGESCDYETNPTGFWKEVAPVTENEKTDKDGYPANGKRHCEIASVGYWQYTQVIKVYDNVKPEIVFTAPDPFCSYSSDQYNGCPAEATINFQVDENCTPEDITIKVQLDKFRDGAIDSDITAQLSGEYPNYTITGSFVTGQHALILTISDGCGNTIQPTIPFEVQDCKAPTPVCINGLAIELMPVIPAADADGDGDLDNGAMAIWASDFIASPVTDCSGEVTYSINRVGGEVHPDQTSITLTCDDDASTLIEIWAYDAAGNGDFCETYVLIQDNMVQCNTGSGAIAGVITTEETETVEGVTVELSGGQFQAMNTKVDGHYAFKDLETETGFDYTVTPHHDLYPLNGVSTFDLVLMSKHILGLQVLDSPYKRIAADINNDKRITAQDAIALRRLILNIDMSFGNNTSWRFIPRDYVFPDPENPWAEEFPEVININDLQGALDQQDFIATKIGDIDLNAKPNLLVAEPRDVKGLFLLDVEDQELKAGNTYTIDFRADQIRDIQGYQLTISLDQSGVELTDLKYGVTHADNFGLRQIAEGLIATSWNKRGDAAESYSKDDILFSLELKAITNAKLSEILGVSSRITTAEAYDLHDGLLDVGIDFNTGIIAKVPFELYQNVPNPFRDETMIGFYLPEASETTISIHDASGRVIKLIRGAFGQGYNRVILQRSELAETGMLYYTLTAGEHTASRKMVLIK